LLLVYLKLLLPLIWLQLELQVMLLLLLESLLLLTWLLFNPILLLSIVFCRYLFLLFCDAVAGIVVTDLNCFFSYCKGSVLKMVGDIYNMS